MIKLIEILNEAKKVKEEELTAAQKKLPPALQKAIEKKDKKEEVELEEACWTGYKKVGMKKKGDKMVPNCIPEEYVTESGDIVEFVELDEGQFKDIDIRKGDLKLAKDKKEQLKNKYNEKQVSEFDKMIIHVAFNKMNNGELLGIAFYI